MQKFKQLSGGDAMGKAILPTTHREIVHPETLAQCETRQAADGHRGFL